MSRKRAAKKISGILVGFTRRWNPLATKVNVLVKVDKRVVKLPIDCRQIKFIQCENAIGDMVEMEFYEGCWHIKSQRVSEEKFVLFPDTPTMPWDVE